MWLNTPRRPQEACGTSGMKAALNGGLNCSILDGWWDEWFDGANGWAISSAEDEDDLDRRDEIEADSLFDLLEQPDRAAVLRRAPRARCPGAWIGRVKHVLASLGPKVTASRMVRDYVTELLRAGRRAGRPDRGRRPRRPATRAGGVEAPRLAAGWAACGSPASTADTGSAELGADRARRRDRSTSGSLEPPTTSRCSCCTARSARATSWSSPTVVTARPTTAPDDARRGPLRGHLPLRPGRPLRLHGPRRAPTTPTSPLRSSSGASPGPDRPGSTSVTSIGRLRHSAAPRAGA